MKNAVFSSFESYLSKDTYNTCEHNPFNLSHMTSFTATYGALIPFYLEDVVPTDHLNYSCIINCQALPMSNPILNNIRLSTWFFFVPYQALWHKFHRYIDGGKDGTYTAEEPYIKAKFSRNSLGDYLDFPIISETGSSSDPIEVSAFPFAAYQSIYKHYFMNQDLQTTGNDSAATSRSFDSWWFPADDNKFALHDGLNWIMDEDDTTLESNQRFDAGTGNSQLYDVDNSGTISSDMLKEPILCAMRFHNFNKDYFTSAMFSPQRGPTQGINTVNPNNPFKGSDFDEFITSSSLGTYGNPKHFFSIDSTTQPLDPDNPTKMFVLADLTKGNNDNETVYNSSVTGGVALQNIKNNLAHFFNSLLAKQGSSAFTISDIMTASQIELWLQRNMQVKSDYQDFLKVHFGYAPEDENYHKPVYIGGTTQLINVSQVVQNSESNITPQGTVTGLARSYNDGYVGKIFCNDFGLIMGIMCIMPEVYYTNGLDKKWVKKSRFDYIFPELSQLPPEPIFNYELFCDNAAASNSKKVFGYAGRYDNYRHRRNHAVSDLRNPNMADFYSWTITREFSSIPSLQSNVFISTNKLMGTISLPADDSTINLRYDHFPTANTVNPFIVQIGLKITGSRPLPFRNEPQTLNLRRG